MSDYNLKKVLMSRDGLTEEEAEKAIACMRAEIEEGADPEELLYDIGLEPDYIESLIE